MATVRMAEYLRRDIVKKFKDFYDKSNPEVKHTTYIGDKVYDLLLGSKTEKFEEQVVDIFGTYINSEKFFIKSNKLPVSLSMLVYDDVREFNEMENKHTREVQEKFEENRKIELPLSSESLQLADQNTSWRETPMTLELDKHKPEDTHLFDLYLKKIISVEQRETKRLAKREVDVDKVETALEQFTTLNQALKAWPALTKLVSQDKISKVHEKQQRKRKEQQQRSKIKPIEQGLNQTILTASLLGDD